MSNTSQTIKNTINFTSGNSAGVSKSNWETVQDTDRFYNVLNSEFSSKKSAPEPSYKSGKNRNEVAEQAKKTVEKNRTQAAEDKPQTKSEQSNSNKETQDAVEQPLEEVDQTLPAETVSPEEPVADIDEPETEVIELSEEVARQIIALQLQLEAGLQSQNQSSAQSEVQTEAEPDVQNSINISTLGQDVQKDSKVKSENDNARHKFNNDKNQTGNVKNTVNTVNTVNIETGPEFQADAQEQLAAKATSIDMTTEDAEITSQAVNAEDTTTVQSEQIKTQTEQVATSDKLIVPAENKTEKTSKNEQNNQQKELENKLKLKESDELNDNARSTGGFQQNAEFASDNGKGQSNKESKFNFGENIVSVSGSSALPDQAGGIKEVLGLDKAPTQEANVNRNIDAVVKSVKSMVQDGNSTMVVRLDPPSLGQVNIRIVSGSDGMSIEIQATNAKAQEMLQQNSSQLKTALENSGISVNNVEVQYKPETKNNANAGSDQQNSQQQDSSSQQNKGQNSREEPSSQRNLTRSNEGAFAEQPFVASEEIYAGAGTQSHWQELAFDTVDVRV